MERLLDRNSVILFIKLLRKHRLVKRQKKKQFHYPFRFINFCFWQKPIENELIFKMNQFFFSHKNQYNKEKKRKNKNHYVVSLLNQKETNQVFRIK